VFVLLSFVMFRFGAGYYEIMGAAARGAIEARRTNVNAAEAMQEFDKARHSPNPMIVSYAGVAGLAIILWLMRFKPF
jgi:hypothetical protein